MNGKPQRKHQPLILQDSQKKKMREKTGISLRKFFAGILAAALIFSAAVFPATPPVYDNDVPILEFSVLDADGYVLASDGSGSVTPSQFRSKSGTVRLTVTLNKSVTGNTAAVTLPAWFSWCRVQDGSDFTVSTGDAMTSTGQDHQQRDRDGPASFVTKENDEKPAALTFVNTYKKSGTSEVDTSDRADITLYGTILVASEALLIILLTFVRRKKKGC